MESGFLAAALVTVLLGLFVGGVLYQHELTARLRRLRAEPTHPGNATFMARRTGTWQAYDDLLAEACRALGIPDSLTEMPCGTERDTERLVVEHRLMEAGLRLGG